MSHPSPCSKPVVGYTCAIHEKNSIRSSAYFPQWRLLSELFWWAVLAWFTSNQALSRQVNARTYYCWQGEHISVLVMTEGYYRGDNNLSCLISLEIVLTTLAGMATGSQPSRALHFTLGTMPLTAFNILLMELLVEKLSHCSSNAWGLFFFFFFFFLQNPKALCSSSGGSLWPNALLRHLWVCGLNF